MLSPGRWHFEDISGPGKRTIQEPNEKEKKKRSEWGIFRSASGRPPMEIQKLGILVCMKHIISITFANKKKNGSSHDRRDWTANPVATTGVRGRFPPWSLAGDWA
jgi:hypothetical protein